MPHTLLALLHARGRRAHIASHLCIQGLAEGLVLLLQPVLSLLLRLLILLVLLPLLRLIPQLYMLQLALNARHHVLGRHVRVLDELAQSKQEDHA